MTSEGVISVAIFPGGPVVVTIASAMSAAMAFVDSLVLTQRETGLAIVAISEVSGAL